MANTQAIDHVLRQAVHAHDVPGVVAMAATDQGIMYEGAFGTRELGTDAAMTPDTVVWIASMTKAITSAAAMQLVERGQLQLDTPAADVVPELAQAQVLAGFDASGTPQLRAPKRAMTLKHLLTHTAGFSYEMFSADIVQVPGGHGHARHHDLRECRAHDTAVMRSGRALGIRHQYRLGWQDRRGGERTKAGRLSAAQPLRAARDAQHLVQDIPVAAGAAGKRACAGAG